MNLQNTLFVLVIALLTLPFAAHSCEIKDGVIIAKNPYACKKQLAKQYEKKFRHWDLINLAEDAKQINHKS